MKIVLLPLTRVARNWAKSNSVKGQDYLVMTLKKRVGEQLTVRAANGKTRTFGPLEATWTKYETEQERTGRVMKLTTHVIASWVEDRDPLLAEAIRQEQWKGMAPKSSKFLSVDFAKSSQKVNRNGK